MSVKNQVLKRGSSGVPIVHMQELLNQNGANLEVDGNFGPKTEAAVKKYQLDKGLTVDGMVGEQTMGALTGGGASDSKEPTAPAGKTPAASVGEAPAASEGFTYDDFSYDEYKQSDTVSQAYAALQQQLAAKPGEYQSTWEGQINGLIDRILNREKFSYDVNEDALYQQMKDQYTSLGKIAMQDTMGQAAAMTGGYGSSYASSAGNQAYQSYLSQLNEAVPELYGMARDQYNQEGQEMYSQYGLLADQENQDYGRWVDDFNQWESERNHLEGVYQDERSFDYDKHTDERNFAYGTYADDKSYAYDEYRNAITDEQWEKTHKLNVNADNREAEAWQLEKQAYEDAKASGGSGDGSDGSVGSGNAALEHVASMSSAEIVDTMKAYNYDEDNTGLAAFLDDCVASGRLTVEQADNYYEKYRTGSANDVFDTTVNPTNNGSISGSRPGGIYGPNVAIK